MSIFTHQLSLILFFISLSHDQNTLFFFFFVPFIHPFYSPKSHTAPASKPLRTAASICAQLWFQQAYTHAKQKSTQPLRNFCSGKPLKDDGLLHRRKTPIKITALILFFFIFILFSFWSRVGAFDCLSMMLLLCGYVVVFFWENLSLLVTSGFFFFFS